MPALTWPCYYVHLQIVGVVGSHFVYTRFGDADDPVKTCVSSRFIRPLSLLPSSALPFPAAELGRRPVRHVNSRARRSFASGPEKQ